MFRTLINDAKTAAGDVIGKYAIRASVAVPFIIAGGFATAAGTLMLVQHLGAVTAYWIMASIFTAIGLIAVFAVSARQNDTAQPTAEAPQPETSDGAKQAAAQLPLALLGALLTTPFGPATASTIAKSLVRHLPLALLIALIGLLLLTPSEPAAEAETASPEPEEPAEPRSDAPPAAPPNGNTREAA